MNPRASYTTSRFSPAFLDAHVLDDCLGAALPDYLAVLPADTKLVTWHSCVREQKLAILKHLTEPSFVGPIVMGKADADARCSNCTRQGTPWCNITRNITTGALGDLAIADEQLPEFRRRVNSRNLALELGIAEESQTFIENFEEYASRFLRAEDRNAAKLDFLLRKFFLLLLYGYREACRELDGRLQMHGVQIIWPDSLFSEPRKVAEARRRIDESLVPNKDAWAVAVAIVMNSALFVTRDEGILKAAPSLGLNHATAFVRPEEILDLVAAHAR